MYREEASPRRSNWPLSTPRWVIEDENEARALAHLPPLPVVGRTSDQLRGRAKIAARREEHRRESETPQARVRRIARDAKRYL